MDDVRGDFLGPPHGTTPAAVIAKMKKNYMNNLHSFLCPYKCLLIRHMFFACIERKQLRNKLRKMTFWDNFKDLA